MTSDIAVTLCDYCWREAMDRAYESGPPGWMSLAHPGSGFCGTRYAVRVGREYDAWLKVVAPDRRCVTVSHGGEYDEWACCATHLVKLAEQLRDLS